MKKISSFFLFVCLALAKAINAQDTLSLDDQLRAHLHKDYFTLNLLIQNEGRYSFKDDGF